MAWRVPHVPSDSVAHRENYMPLRKFSSHAHDFAIVLIT